MYIITSGISIVITFFSHLWNYAATFVPRTCKINTRSHIIISNIRALLRHHEKIVLKFFTTQTIDPRAYNDVSTNNLHYYLLYTVRNEHLDSRGHTSRVIPPQYIARWNIVPSIDPIYLFALCIFFVKTMYHVDEIAPSTS